MAWSAPDVGGRIEKDAVAITTRPLHLAHCIHDPDESTLAQQSGPRVLQRLQHALKRPSGVRCQKQIVRDHTPVEGSRLAECPRFVATLAIESIEVSHRCSIDKRNRDGICD